MQKAESKALAAFRNLSYLQPQHVLTQRQGERCCRKLGEEGSCLPQAPGHDLCRPICAVRVSTHSSSLGESDSGRRVSRCTETTTRKTWGELVSGGGVEGWS